MTVGSDRLALFGAVIVLFAAYIGMYRPAEAALAERYARLDAGRSALARRELIAAHAAPLRAEQRALARELAATGVTAGRAAVVERCLHLVAARAAADGVRVAAIAADAVPPVATPPFDIIPLTLAVRGPYAGLIRFVRDLGRDGLAARVGIDALDDPGPRGGARPDLRASLHVALLHLARPLDGGPGGTI
jgi:Tfp pilus assembly protein PilO